MLELIKRNKVAFGVNKWTFADAATETRKRIETKTMGHLVYDKTTNNLQDKVFESDTGKVIADYLGTEIPGPSAETLARRAEERAAYDQVYGNESAETLTRQEEEQTAYNGSMMDVEEQGMDVKERGRGGRRTRRSKRNKRGKTRKGKSRKGRTMKHRRHYRK
jgi:hypothetical protein